MVRALITGIFDLLVPPRRTEQLVRSLSLEMLQLLNTPEGLPYHDPRVTALVWELKYYANKKAAVLAGEVLAEVLLALAGEELGRPLLIPIPMHAARRKERGHNQTEMLCTAAVRGLSDVFEYVPTALTRIQNTPPQQGLERTKRLKNVKNAMVVEDPDRVAGRVCVVVDDVATTGATLKEARRALRLAGARRVHLISLAYS